jgi:hypothetical protein
MNRPIVDDLNDEFSSDCDNVMSLHSSLASFPSVQGKVPEVFTINRDNKAFLRSRRFLLLK